MPTMRIPPRFPATPNDLATSVMRNLNQHLELGCRLTFDERLDEDVLRQAFRLTLDAEPILGCGLRTDFMTAWWERLDTLNSSLPFSVVQSDDPDRDCVEFQVGQVPDSGPQVAALLVRGPESDEVCFRISHSVADGQATKQYAYLLAEMYTKLLGNPSFAPYARCTPRPSAEDMWRRISAEDRRAAVREPRPVMPNWRLPRKAATGEGRTLRELRLASDRFRHLKAYGKARSATVNEMLLAAFFRAATACFPQDSSKPLSLAFSADHRRYLRDEPDIPISNLAITIWLGLEEREGEAFDATLERVVQKVGVWRNALWGAKGAVKATDMTSMGYKPMELVMKGIARISARSGKTSPVFTNIGVLDEGRLAFGEHAPSSARLSGPAAFGASLVPTISTYRDALTVSMGFCEQDMDAGAVEAVLRGMDAELALRHDAAVA